jgi:hypothetical protein
LTQLSDRQINGPSVRGKLKPDTISVDRDSQTRATSWQAKQIAKRLLGEFVNAAVDAQQDSRAVVND